MKKNPIKIYLYLTLCVLFWSGNFIIGRFIKDDMSPIELAFFRWFFVLIFISPIFIIRWNNIINSLKKHFWIMLVLSALGVSAFNTILYLGLSKTTATNSLVINSIIPILVLIMSFVILHQKINYKQVIGIFISTIGMLYLILQGDFYRIYLLKFNQGDFWIIGAAFIWALYSVVLKFKPTDLSDFEFFSLMVFIGFLLLLPFYLYQGFSLSYGANLVYNNFWVFFYISVFTSIISYYFWHKGIHTIGATKTSQFAHLMPIFGSFLAYIFLDEVLHFYHIVGMTLIGGGIYLSLSHKHIILRK
ncbi:MAG: EamA family transporter [Gammaproteobacteria bacterium]|nr:MAG: EamA family transporter [Gammaproteobacteria bacterium]